MFFLGNILAFLLPLFRMKDTLECQLPAHGSELSENYKLVLSSLVGFFLLIGPPGKHEVLNKTLKQIGTYYLQVVLIDYLGTNKAAH